MEVISEYTSLTCGVSFPRFFGVENPNLWSGWSLEVNGGHWGHPMTSKMEVISEYTSYTCLVSFPKFFLGRRIQIRGQIEVKRSVESLGSLNDLHWPPKWWSFQNTPSYTYAVFFPRFFVVENPILRSDWCSEINGITEVIQWYFLTHVGCIFLGFF